MINATALVSLLTNKYAIAIGTIGASIAYAPAFLPYVLVGNTMMFATSQGWGRSVFKKIERFIPGFVKKRITGSSRIEKMEKKYRKSSEALLRGDKEAVADEMWPADRFPSVRMAVPAYLYQGPDWSGRLIGGVPMEWLGWNSVTPESIREADKLAGEHAFGLTALFSVLSLVALAYTSGFASLPFPSWAWDAGMYSEIGKWLVGSVFGFLISSVLSVGAVALSSILFYMSAKTGFFYSIYSRWFNLTNADLSKPTLDALVMYKNQYDSHELAYSAYLNQLAIYNRVNNGETK